MTVATCVCCSMISLIQMAYKSFVRRHGRSRASRSYHRCRRPEKAICHRSGTVFARRCLAHRTPPLGSVLLDRLLSAINDSIRAAAATENAVDQQIKKSKNSYGDHKPMQAFLASFMALLLAAHAAFGCCWHHVHAAGHSAQRDSHCRHCDHDTP